MLKHNFLTYSGQIIAKIIGEIIYFPIWWYSLGLLKTIKQTYFFWLNREKALGFSIWLKNIFVPMYGQYDIASRIISFFMRLIQVIFRGLILIVWLILSILAVLLWIAVPLLLFFALFFQIGTFYGI